MEFRRFAIGVFGGVFFIYVIYAVLVDGPSAPLMWIIRWISGSSIQTSFVFMLVGILFTIIAALCFLYIFWSVFFSGEVDYKFVPQSLSMRSLEVKPREVRSDFNKKEVKQIRQETVQSVTQKTPMMNMVYYIFLGALVILAIYFIFFAGR